VLCGGIIAGIGSWLRERTAGGNDQWTYVLDTFGLLVAVIGAILDFRASARITEFRPDWGRRRATLLAVSGVAAGLGSCIVLGWVTTLDSPAARGALTAVWTAAIGISLAGLLHIGWFRGSGWLERRIEQCVDEEW
jgi:O-antigen/teichoic acid export membrane protein